MRLLCDIPGWGKAYNQSLLLRKSTTAGHGHSLLQDLALCCLWVAKVHHLVQQLVNDDEVVANTLFLQYLEIFCKDFHDLVEEEEDLGGIGISLG